MAPIDNDEDSGAAGSDRNGQEENLGNGEYDRMFGEELDSNDGRANELDVPEGMEAGATGPASVVAPASMSSRESFPTGVEPGSQNEFAPPDSPQVGNDSRLEELFDTGTAAIPNRDSGEPSLPRTDPETSEKAQGLSASRSDNDDLSVAELDLMPTPLSEILAAEYCLQTHLLSFLTVEEMEDHLRDIFDSLPAFAWLVEEDVQGIAESMVSSLAEDNANSISVRDRMLRYFNRLNSGGICPNNLEPLYQWLESLVPPAASMAGEGGNGKEPQQSKGETGSDSSSVTSKKKERQPYRCGFCGALQVEEINGVRVPHGTCPRHQGTEMGTEIEGTDNDIDRILLDTPENYTVMYQSTSSISHGQGDPNRNDASDGESDDDNDDEDDDDDRKPAAAVRQSASQDPAPTEDNADEEDDQKPAAVDRQSASQDPAPTEDNADEEDDRKPAAVDRRSASQDPAPTGDSDDDEDDRKPAAVDRRSASQDPAPTGDSDDDEDDRKPAAVDRRSALQDPAPTEGSADPRPPSAGRIPARARDEGMALSPSTSTSSERENSSTAQAPIEGGEASSPFRRQAHDRSSEEETPEPDGSGGSGDEL